MINFIHWSPKPELFSINLFGMEFAPRWYGVLFAAGFVLGYYIIKQIFKKEGIKQELLDSLTVYMFLGTVVGARLGHCLFYEPAYYLADPIKIFKIWEGGLASHGAAIGILISLYLFGKKHKKPFLWVVDRIVIVTALGGAFIRLGNLVNSEIVGNPTNVSWGFVFERLGEDFARHPAQLYEALAYFAIFGVLCFMYSKTKWGQMNGALFGWFLVFVFGFRFFVEFTKDVQVDFEQGMTLIMGQILSIPFVLTGVAMLYFAKKKYKK